MLLLTLSLVLSSMESRVRLEEVLQGVNVDVVLVVVAQTNGLVAPPQDAGFVFVNTRRTMQGSEWEGRAPPRPCQCGGA